MFGNCEQSFFITQINGFLQNNVTYKRNGPEITFIKEYIGKKYLVLCTVMRAQCFTVNEDDISKAVNRCQETALSSKHVTYKSWHGSQNCVYF